MLLPLLLIALSIAVLYAGGEVLVRYATALARALRINPLIVGLTVIAFGTSAPELAAALSAAAAGSPALAAGNVIGSNIANVGLILGLAVLVNPIRAELSFLRREMPFMIFSAVLVVGCVATGAFTRWQAALLLILMVLFLRSMLAQGAVPHEEDGVPDTTWIVGLVGSSIGIVLLVVGADLMVDNAVILARRYGVSERVIGLTLVAFGTSVPELASALVAALRQQTGLLIGNIVGSNIFNTLLILPAALLVHPFPVRFAEFGIDALVALGFAVLLLLLFLIFGRHTVHRWEGAVLLTCYAAYVGHLAVSQ
ncbi:MAG: sodium:calcium antiporter [Acidobacteria bacterium]|nr:MAG: sodium:calcium antiporter [Acidobacteriota bacterium]REK00838.1 MAG: sodium:calcium antiporter [Acidobacteriota bacterium]